MVNNILSLRKQQTSTLVMITFWSQFASYSLNTILILFLTQPILSQGLGYSQAKAYAFIGISSATGYLMPILGGYMADNIIGLRRSILLGGILLACAYLLIMLSGLSISTYGDTLFLTAYALTPAANSLLIGTASGMVSRIYNDDTVNAKSAMTFYYMAINVGALLATLIAPSLLDSRYGPLSVLAITFVGKAIAALNFLYRYAIYNPIICGKDTHPMTPTACYQLMGYLLAIYGFTLFAYYYIALATVIIAIGCSLGILWFIFQTAQLSGEGRIKQSVAIILIMEAIVFFVIYNQMNTTLVLFAQQNSNAHFFGMKLSPAHYQMINPLLIIALGLQLPRFYQKFPRFSIPYQFACGALLAGIALLVLAYAPTENQDGMVSGFFIAITYLLITLAELWVSAIGLSMIGLYCNNQALGFAMGAWYLGCSLSSAISGRIAHWVALPATVTSPQQSLTIYQNYYEYMGLTACALGGLMLIIAYGLHRVLKRRNLVLA
jgi:POT family proton-dependent oligopeptide transporter